MTSVCNKIQYISKNLLINENNNKNQPIDKIMYLYSTIMLKIFIAILLNNTSPVKLCFLYFSERKLS